jgi:hypothetical protein
MTLEAYCLKTKSKEEMVDPVIHRTTKGGYIAKGTTKDGYKVSLILSGEKANEAVKAGIRKEGW